MSGSKKRARTLKAALKPNTPTPKCNDIEDLDFGKEQIVEIRECLLEWYDRNQRDLPWRRISIEDLEKRAYAVWVSEVMLQQTRVQTVVDYFNRWMDKWPTIYHLSTASIELVNQIWAGLGYYRRARFLLEGAKMIVEEGGEFPKTVPALRKVKGIGDYTAGAIASIAFNEVVPVVDGNVVRVIARLKAISANPKDKVTVNTFWKLAGELVDSCRPGDFNQALMELGATICTPLSPKCSSCPISSQCQAFSLTQHKESASVTDYPSKVIKPKQRHEWCAVTVVETQIAQELGLESSSKFLLVKRPNKGLLAGLWEFPSVILETETDLTVRREAVDKFMKSSLTLDHRKDYKILLREDVGEYIHVFSHIRLKMYIELLVLEVKDMKGKRSVSLKPHNIESVEWKYVDNQELTSMGLTSGVRKVYSMVQKYKESKLSSTSSSSGAKKNAGARKASKS
ncbi:DNA glycosylase [Lithospermum erythrorhizon]|uniref:Adenine DNA glycosylase n=1 Tax=Lithospermum erythrorhizon TaxID=34254 RepID=A0AAV3NUT2_LITER